MFRMAVGHSDDIDLDAALEIVFRQCDAGLAGVPPRAGLLLTAWAPDPDAVLAAVRQRYPGIQLAGSTTAGEMSSILGFVEDSITLALFASDAVEITAGLGTALAADPAAAAREAVDEARRGSTLEPALCIVMPTVARVDPARILAALRTSLGPGVPVLGGGAAPEELEDPRGVSRQFAGDRQAEDGVAILLFSGPLAFSFGTDTGWRPLGPRATVTSASGLSIMTIDGETAVGFYERYLGAGEPAIGNPLAVFEPDSEHVYLRAPVAYDRDAGSVQFFGGVPEGSTVQLSMAATDDLFDGVRGALGKAAAAFPAGSPDGALVFSCAIRKFVLGTRAGREIEIARDLLGADMPIAGFYCFGEIAPVVTNGSSRFHNETIVAVLLGSD